MHWSWTSPYAAACDINPAIAAPLNIFFEGQASTTGVTTRVQSLTLVVQQKKPLLLQYYYYTDLSFLSRTKKRSFGFRHPPSLGSFPPSLFFLSRPRHSSLTFLPFDS